MDWRNNGLDRLNDVDRVRAHTPERVNREIDQAVKNRLHTYANASPALVTARLEALDQEWDVERTLELQAALTALLGLVLGVFWNRKWLWLTAINQFFLLAHVLHGWCPPVALQRRLGKRTRREIQAEQVALKALRGDFRAVSEAPAVTSPVEAALAAATTTDPLWVDAKSKILGT